MTCRLSDRARRPDRDVRRTGAAARSGAGRHPPLRNASSPPARAESSSSGPRSASPITSRSSRHATRIDARGCTVVPGFVDPHTHVVYAGDRREELQRRLAGATTRRSRPAGGGIAANRAATRAASEDELSPRARARLDEMPACGTTTCEAKSGYGLTIESELRQLRAIKRLDASMPIDLVPTFLGAHEIPDGVPGPAGRLRGAGRQRDDSAGRGRAAGRVVRRLLREGAFTPQESVAILSAGARAGLKPRVHADELARSGGARWPRRSARGRRIT